MTINHIDQLTEWWENAEKSVAHVGDTVIHYEVEDGSYMVYTLDAGPVGPWSRLRVLERAPKPKPAWHDAVAVIAHRQGDYGLTAREVYVSGVDDKWESAHYYARTSELIDPVPLIEAKVTDEMVEAAQQEAKRHTGLILERFLVSRVLTAALGLEAE